jgi:hypothetical protein
MPDPEKSAAERFFRIDDLLRNVFEQLGDNEVRKVFTITQRSLVVGVDIMQSRKSMPFREANKRSCQNVSFDPVRRIDNHSITGPDTMGANTIGGVFKILG